MFVLTFEAASPIVINNKEELAKFLFEHDARCLGGDEWHILFWEDVFTLTQNF
jgi:hypothetical protein